MKKHIARLLLLAMLTGMLAACGGGEVETESDTNPESAQPESEETAPVEEENALKMGVPDGKTFDGETITIWYTTGAVVTTETFMDLAGDIEGDAVDDGVYKRNVRIQDTLDVTLDYRNNTDVTSSNTGPTMEKLIHSDDNTYDLFCLVQWNGAGYTCQNMFYNVKDAPYISYDAPWWNYDYMKEMTIGEDKLYCLVGDTLLDTTRCLSCVYYNKAMYENFYQDADGLYDVVLDGDWNLDLVMKIAEEVYDDTNGDGKKDYDDRLGYSVDNVNQLDAFMFGGGQRVTTRDENDIPSITILNEANENTIQKVLTFTNDCVGGLCYGNDPIEQKGSGGNGDRIKEKFFSREMMFMFGFLYTAESMREMEDDYGILPYPKALETQDSYGSVVHDIMEFLVLPVNAKKVDTTCAVLEAMAYYGYEDLLPVYYEQILKGRYARDQKSSQMIDVIRDSMATDIAYIYLDKFSMLGYAPRYIVMLGLGSLSVYCAQKMESAEHGMQELIDQFTSLE